MRYSKQDFVAGQGCVDASLYSALMFQPRVIAILVAAGIGFQSPAIFAALGMVLAWSTLLPQFNPFDAIYSAWSGNRRIVAPAPRRFSQGMGSAMTFAAAVAMSLGATNIARTIEALIAFSVVTVVGLRSCMPANIYNRFFAAGDRRNASCVAS